LMFSRVASIQPLEGSKVMGALWDITRPCEAELDRYEGVRGGLYRKEYIKVGDVYCLTYIMNRDPYALPFEGYLMTIKQGYEDWGISLRHLAAAVSFTNQKLKDTKVQNLIRSRRKVFA
jgi:hypothetical protein